MYRVGQKMAPFIACLITSPNINRFSKFFYFYNQETIRNKTGPITPQVCCYTTLWNVRWCTKAGDATDQLCDQRWSSLACGSPNSLDLNLVDYAVRGAVQQMAYQSWWFTTVNQLKKAIVAEWGKVTQRLVNRAFGQWRCRLGCVIQQQGKQCDIQH